MAKVALSKKKTLFTSKLDLNLRKKLVKCYIWSIALYGAETWTLRAVDQKHLKGFEMLCWRRWRRPVAGYKIEKNEIVGVCSTRRGEEMCIQGFDGETWGKETIWKTPA